MKEFNLRAVEADFEKAGEFINTELKHNGVSTQIAGETCVLFEAIFNDIILRGYPEDTPIQLRIKRSFGNLNIRIAFPGKMYVPGSGDGGEFSVEDKIIKAYEDKLECIYYSSYNVLNLTVKRGFAKRHLLCMAGFVGAIALYALLSHMMSFEKLDSFRNIAVVPVEKLYANAIFLVGTPMTFFSLLKNILETHIISERSSDSRKLEYKTLCTSLLAIVIAVLLGVAVHALSPVIRGAFGTYSIPSFKTSELPGLISSFVPSSVFEPFTALLPIPLIVITLMLTYALCSAGKYFFKLKNAIDACYVLFSRMLNLIVFFQPFFCFIAFMDLLLSGGLKSLYGVVLCICAVTAGLVSILLVYVLRLKAAGVKVIDFTKRVAPVIAENIRINSAIDAVPYNVRQCTRKLGIDRNYLENAMPVLSQLNLDGNCLILMLLATLVTICSGTSMLTWNFVTLAVLVLFLSFGAPNQPGSILIGTLILISYLGVPQLMPIAIYCDVLFGLVQNMINVTGDIVMVAINSQKAKLKGGGKKQLKKTIPQD